MFKNKFVSDIYEERFEDETAFLQNVSEKEAATQWVAVTSGQASIVPYAGPLFVPDIMANSYPGVEEEAVRDTLEKEDKPHFFLGVAGKMIPFTVSGFRQFYSAAAVDEDPKLNEDMFKYPDKLIGVFDLYTSFGNRVNRVNRVCVCGSKVRAAGSEEYVIMPMDELFAAVLPVLRKNFALEFVRGYNSHDYTKATYRVTGDARDTLMTKYNEMISHYANMRAAVSKKNVEFLVLIQSSHSKSSLATLTPVLELNGAVVPVGTRIGVQHRRKSGLCGIDALKAEAPAVFAKFLDIRSKFAEMSNITVNYPQDCLINVCGDAKIPKKIVSQCADHLSAFLGTNTSCTAFDVFLSICEATVYADIAGMGDRVIDDITEAVSRIVVKGDWKASDHRTDVH